MTIEFFRKKNSIGHCTKMLRSIACTVLRTFLTNDDLLPYHRIIYDSFSFYARGINKINSFTNGVLDKN